MDPELRSIMERVDRVESQSFVSLYKHAPPELNAGSIEIDGVQVGWLGSYEDAGFSAISNIDAAPDPDAALETIIEQLKQAGVKVIGLDDHPDLDPKISPAWLAERGFAPDFQEQIWWRPLDDIEVAPEPAGLRIERATESDRKIFASILNEGFGNAPDAGLGPAFAEVINKEGWYHYIAYVDDEPGAAAAMFVAERVADCFVASTRPAARRRGAQTALIVSRMIDGRDAGCDIATAQSVMDNASPRNFGRRGFRPLYRRMIYARRLA